MDTSTNCFLIMEFEIKLILMVYNLGVLMCGWGPNEAVEVRELVPLSLNDLFRL